MKNIILIFLLAIIFSCSENNKQTESKQDTPTIKSESMELDKLDEYLNASSFILLDSSTGDLNKDNFSDLVLVLEKKDKTKRAAIIFIYDSADKSYKKSSESESLILSPNKDMRNMDYDTFDDVKINNGTVTFSQSLVKGWFRTIFRLQKKEWELIGYTASFPDNEWISEIDYNLNTGNLTIDKTLIGKDSVSRRINEKKILKPLPSFNKYKPFTIEFLVDGSNIWL